jgi:hypothetical protein
MLAIMSHVGTGEPITEVIEREGGRLLWLEKCTKRRCNKHLMLWGDSAVLAGVDLESLSASHGVMVSAWSDVLQAGRFLHGNFIE